MEQKKSGALSEYQFKPYVDTGKSIPEFTFQAVILGFILSVVFNAANAYLGLKIGMTVSASIPSAIISMTVLRIILPKFFGRTATILENNAVHAFASIGESLAAAIIFTVPAIFFMGGKITNSMVFLLGLTGGILGLLMMIPLRHSLMVKEHKNLPFPEGSACAKVLIAGDQGGASAKPVFAGMLTGGLFKFVMSGFLLFRDTISWSFASLNKAGFGYEISPLFLGVGYLVGLRIAAVMFAGGAFGYWVLIPAINAFGGANIVSPGTIPIADMTTADIRGTYVKYIGAGGVAFGGLISVIRSLPDIISSVKGSVAALTVRAGEKQGAQAACEKDFENNYIVWAGGILGAIIGIFAFEIPWHLGPASWDPVLQLFAGVITRVFLAGSAGALILGFCFWAIARGSAKACHKFLRIEQDTPLPMVLAGVVAMFLLLWLVPMFDLTFVEALIVVVFCMFFVAVSARMVGLIGTTNQPVSGMTITALLSLTLIFVFIGHDKETAKVAAIMAGAVVCIAISVSGDLSQDLKTAALIGATPWKVQLAQISGALVSAVRSGFILLLLYMAFGLGAPTPEHPNPLEAPQAQLMAKLVEGATGGSLPWLLLGLGGAIGLVCELAGVSALAFSIGLYLPITNWPMILLGGLIAWFVSRKAGGAPEEEHDPGSLFASGLIAGDALMGIGIAGIIVLKWNDALKLRDPWAGSFAFEAVLSTALYLGIAVALYLVARKKHRKAA
ncbi:MAG: oligopeptide transporter, OPT family [Elusimicrobia bacterium GWA2_62_23]|nr:MAG: oligopeptide transporter, OPT family [Elusimicrobia bacterium GWA2_62_23]